tara:strand:+ start:1070 stop:1345 length:276 start_codon:yes stop_codon:yes gene_type:complete
MSTPIKFTQEELDKITLLRDSNSQKIGEFGQVELEVLLVTQRLEALNDTKQTLIEDYVKLQSQEKDLVQTLNEKYGAGQVDLSSGEFIPVK